MADLDQYVKDQEQAWRMSSHVQYVTLARFRAAHQFFVAGQEFDWVRIFIAGFCEVARRSGVVEDEGRFSQAVSDRGRFLDDPQPDERSGDQTAKPGRSHEGRVAQFH